MGAFLTNGDLINILFFNFFNLGDIFLFLAVFKNSSKVPFLSTHLTPALLTVKVKLLFKSS